MRFAEQKRVHDTIEKAVSEALRVSDRSGWEYVPAAARIPGKNGRADYGNQLDTGPERFVAERPTGYKGEASSGLNSESQSGPGYKDKVTPNAPVTDKLPQNNFKPAGLSAPGRAPDQPERLWKTHPFAELKIIGQFYETYIVCESAQGLVLIDQHAAHERVAYEELKRAAIEKQAAAQRLLMPENLELGFREAAALERLLPALARVGFEIEPFGANAYVISSVPALLARAEAAPMVREIVETYVEVGIPDDPGKILDPCIELMACHSVIRANQALTPDQSRALLKQLDACENPSHCPHGRPIWIRWSVKELEKLFKRTL